MKSIVYIDDDLDDIATFEEVIPKINSFYHLKSFSDPLNALECLDDGSVQPDIIFLDINMPELTGKEFLLLLRKNTLFSDIPIIMYSTSIPEEEKTLLLQLGANSVLKKAIDYSSLTESLKRTLKQNLENVL